MSSLVSEISASDAVGDYEVVEQSPCDLLPACVEILNATRRRESDEARFEWLYRRNPDGEAVVWMARAVDGAASGFVAALPRRMLVDGTVRTCWNGADASVVPSARRQGLAGRLRAATRAGVDEGRVDFFYAHPNERMAGAHRRAGNQALGRMVRVRKILGLGPYAAERLRSRALGRVVSTLIDPVLRWRDRAPEQHNVEAACVGEQLFDGRYDELFWREAEAGPRVVGVRDARYLNWRYAENPLYRTLRIEAAQQGRLAGYLLYVMDGDSVQIKDVFPMHHPEVVGALAAALLRQGYSEGWRSIGFVALESNPLLPALQGVGFRRQRETSEMFTYCRGDRAWAGAIGDKGGWWLTVGDRDV